MTYYHRYGEADQRNKDKYHQKYRHSLHKFLAVQSAALRHIHPVHTEVAGISFFIGKTAQLSGKVFFIVLSIVLLQSSFESTIKGAILSNIFLLALASAALFVLMQFIPVLARKEQMEEKMHMYEMNRAYYENLEKQQQEIRILRHDMANHLQVISRLDGEQQKEYIEKLTGSFAMGVQVKFCDNRVLNGVLNSKRSAAENGGIEFQVEAAVPEKLCVDGVDLCALIGNGLDNAIEACMKCPEGGRYVNAVIKAEKGILAVKIENPAAEGVHLVDGNLPATTKKASQGHGFGLRSMKEIAQRYGGKLELSLSDDGKKAVLLVWLSLTPADKNASAGTFTE